MHTVQRLKNKLHKKKHGMLDDFLPIIVFILLLTVLLFTFVEFNGAVNKKTEVNQVARRYILKMEQTGYATSSIQNAIVQELNDLGYAGDTTGAPVTTQNITDNTTKAHQGYGSDICLEFVVYTTNTWLSTDPEFDLFSPKFEESEYVPITIKYYSTSKE